VRETSPLLPPKAFGGFVSSLSAILLHIKSVGN
jgi:hypothetical protein